MTDTTVSLTCPPFTQLTVVPKAASEAVGGSV